MNRAARDLFGDPLPSPGTFRKDGARRKVGYPARPGTGPKGKRCALCKHAESVLHKGNRTTKCALMAHAWTHGEETDIHPNAPACKRYERKPLAPLKYK